jgi:hypothetical protein
VPRECLLLKHEELPTVFEVVSHSDDGRPAIDPFDGQRCVLTPGGDHQGIAFLKCVEIARISWINSSD